MAWYPAAIRKNIPPGSNDPPIIPVGCVLHVAVSEAASLYDYFNGPSGGIESHWYIRRDGTVEQYRDTHYEADANYKGNSWISGGRRYGLHSIETQGMEHGEWTADQIAAIKDLLSWDAHEHDWPLQVAPDWTGPGVGYHVMWGAPGPWTPVVSKSCPGPDRVRQFHDVITPWLNDGGDDMPTAKEIADELANYGTTSPVTGNPSTLLNQIRWGYRRADDAANRSQPVRENNRMLRTLIEMHEDVDTDTILAKLDQMAAEDERRDHAMADQLDGVAAMVAELDAGNATPAEIVEGIRELLHSGTAPADES